jgi:tripartite-type tricarboxylate transporter receptor subunit TctC
MHRSLLGVFAPAGTSAAIVDKLDAEATGILRSAATQRALNSVGTDAAPISQAAFAERIRAEAARYAVIIQGWQISGPQ